MANHQMKESKKTIKSAIMSRKILIIITFLSVAAFITATKPAREKSAAGQSDIDTMADRAKTEVK